MDALPTVDPNLARAAAFFTLWRTSPLATQAVVQAIVKQYAKRTPKLLEALEEVAQLYERIRHPEKDSIPIDQRIAIDAKDISLFFAMTQNRPYAKARALATLWRDGDALLRGELEQLIRSEVQAAPSFRQDLVRAASQLDQYVMPERNERMFILL